MKHFFTLLLAISAIILHAQPGTIDKSYGTDGTGTISVSTSFILLSSAMQPDDKQLLGGKDLVAGKFILLRHRADGSLDSSFGDGGQAVITINDLLPNITSTSGWVSVSAQPDGKITAVGGVFYRNTAQNILFDDDIVVARFLADGTPDESFGSHGRVVTELGQSETTSSVAVQPDGKIVVAGSQTKADINNNSGNILLVHYNTDGSLDREFGGGDGFITYSPANRAVTAAGALLIQPDGKIVVGGVQISSPPESFLLIRYLPDGTLDASFGKEGVVKATFPSQYEGTQIKSLALDDKGRIVAAGVVGTGEGVEVLRYLPDGADDNSFNQNGQLRLSFNGISYSQVNVSAVLPQPGGKLVVSSFVTSSLSSPALTPVLTGLNEDGSADLSFGVAGQTISTLPLSDNLLVTAEQSDGKIVLGGNNYNYTTSVNTYSLTRYLGYPVHVSLLVRIRRWLQNHTLSWQGLPAEDKIAYYTVEQSANGISGFSQVSKVNGVSNLKDYSITNSHLLQGNNYYRIKSVSTDGVVRYSEVVSADNAVNTASVFPNPAKSFVTVQGLAANETANISIKDGSGTILARGVSKGSGQYRSPLGSNMHPGTYYLNITTGSTTEVLKFVKE